ncbi:MAG: VTC domain-containing protein [Planctomycetes bacterium]|nr:VTC domain-containing protein [Planctomycetota bacterium]
MSIFGRREIKYELEMQEAKRLKEVVSKHLPLYEFRRGRSHTFISTIYYDTDLYEFYNRATHHYDNNTKIRVKEYYYELGDGKTLEWFPCCFVEIKQRVEGLVIKRRLRVPKSFINQLFEGKNILDQLVNSDPSLAFDDFGEVYNELRRYLQHYTVRPRSIINYRRTVYQKNEEELRVTFDENLEVFQPVRGLYDRVESLNRQTLGRPIQTINKVILEIKCKENRYPEWLEKELGSMPPRRVSKFTTSINLLTRELDSANGSDIFNMGDTPLGGRGTGEVRPPQRRLGKKSNVNSSQDYSKENSSENPS